jgi:dTDP-4-amino-4,6-dideoxygalactose transaminase
MPTNKKIFVTRPTLPKLDDYVKKLEVIWDNKWLTNNGPFHQEFEQKLAKYLDVPYISLFSNGTLALMIALKVLDIKGEVITTPYTFVATSHALLWNSITPVFCDIDPVYGNLDVDKIEALITDKTTAIVPVHVYGNPVEVEKIDAIAKKYNLKIIYDAAHAFAVKKANKSILNFGDLSILSFHATKVFNTIEGGAIVCQDLETKKQIDYLKNFGFENETNVVTLGINAKMNELQAAFGLLQLETIDDVIDECEAVTALYRVGLADVRGIHFLEDIPNVKHNYSYFPIFISPEYTLTRDELYSKLKDYDIYTRRYFYPLVTDFPVYKKIAKNAKLSNAVRIAKEVICLPLYDDLTVGEVNRIITLIKTL